MREIPLTQGKVALVDDEDYEAVAKYRWQAFKPFGNHRIWYACRNGPSPQRRHIRMHREILGLSPGWKPEVDHINGDGTEKANAIAARLGAVFGE